MGYAKDIHEKKMYWKTWTSIQEFENNWYLDAHLEKKRKKKKR
jgi:hypothetical protein